ncbi:hypothetical protein ALC56_03607 [Trachymyrmex septentrionalis]|uniref:Regulatory protein zeste n=1 Tax=Trachymyrmex septentrionalis TaxID=34720 RepID=A0A195FNK6_9HYME|nr:hypothetical protein ALC56_03607 [Trachymyrmex septentrionalis]
MSCKENINPSKSKHTNLERKIFLQILEQYKHMLVEINVVEIKKSDATTLKDKEAAWTEICATCNESSLIAR